MRSFAILKPQKLPKKLCFAIPLLVNNLYELYYSLIRLKQFERFNFGSDLHLILILETDTLLRNAFRCGGR
jgi:hypothetical protein